MSGLVVSTSLASAGIDEEQEAVFARLRVATRGLPHVARLVDRAIELEAQEEEVEAVPVQAARIEAEQRRVWSRRVAGLPGQTLLASLPGGKRQPQSAA